MSNLNIDEMLARIVALEAENTQLKAQVEKLSINTNFNCLTRAAGFHQASLLLDRRNKEGAGGITMVVLDVAGMGASNKARGEEATNKAMTTYIEQIKAQVRGVLVIHQINSGDEFVFYCQDKDTHGIEDRLHEMARENGFSGAYVSHATISGVLSSDEIVELVNETMKMVYLLKEVYATA